MTTLHPFDDDEILAFAERCHWILRVRGPYKPVHPRKRNMSKPCILNGEGTSSLKLHYPRSVHSRLNPLAARACEHVADTHTQLFQQLGMPGICEEKGAIMQVLQCGKNIPIKSAPMYPTMTEILGQILARYPDTVGFELCTCPLVREDSAMSRDEIGRLTSHYAATDHRVPASIVIWRCVSSK